MRLRLLSSFSVFLLTLSTIPSGSILAADASTAGQDATFPAQFQATVYEVQVPTNQLVALDAKTLAGKAGTADELLEVLANVGTAHILYRVDQLANVYSERIVVGSSEPVITGIRTSAKGEPIKSITYMNVGVIIRLSAQLPPPNEIQQKEPDVNLNIQLSALAPGDTELAPGVKATITRTAAIEHRETLQFGKPQVMLSIDMTKEDMLPTAFVIRYLFTKP